MAAPVPDDYWTFFAGEAKRGHSPLYERFALAIRDDDKLRAIATRAKPGQPQANIILGAVHYLLLGDASHPLADHYPSVRPQARPEGDPVPLFREFCLAHEGEIVTLVETRVTNTNEVARSTALYPAFDFIARETGGALHIIEIGPSAGLNLNWDRYRYTYRANGALPLTRGPDDARLNLEAELRGPKAPPLAPSFPKVASRVGLELNPVDLRSIEDRRWLKALIWPELTRRFERLDAAIATARAHPQPIVAGDALELLEPVARAVPNTGTLVVDHSHVTYQFSEAMRTRLNDILETISRIRPLYRVSIEWDGASYPVNVGRYDNGRVDKRTIALCDPHGTWLEWRGDND